MSGDLIILTVFGMQWKTT